MPACAVSGPDGLLYMIQLRVITLPSGIMVSPAATPLWNSGHNVSSAALGPMSRWMMASFGGILPERFSGGSGSCSAMSGATEPSVNMPRPTDAASDLPIRSNNNNQKKSGAPSQPDSLS